MDDLREFCPPVGTWRRIGYMALSSPSPVSLLASLGSIRPHSVPFGSARRAPTRLGFQPEMTSVRLSSVSKSVKKLAQVVHSWSENSSNSYRKKWYITFEPTCLQYSISPFPGCMPYMPIKSRFFFAKTSLN